MDGLCEKNNTLAIIFSNFCCYGFNGDSVRSHPGKTNHELLYNGNSRRLGKIPSSLVRPFPNSFLLETERQTITGVLMKLGLIVLSLLVSSSAMAQSKTYCRVSISSSSNHLFSASTLITRSSVDQFYPSAWPSSATDMSCRVKADSFRLREALRQECLASATELRARATITILHVSPLGSLRMGTLTEYCQDLVPENYRCNSFDKVRRVWINHPESCGSGGEGGGGGEGSGGHGGGN